MERRQYPRFEADQEVCVTVLTEPEQQHAARLMNISGSGMRLLAPRPLAAGTLLKVEWDNTLLLGEAVYSEPVGDGYAIGMKLEHFLADTEALARLAKRLLDEAPEQARVPARRDSGGHAGDL
jgi:hypothetical protein